jgi:hypothetical protein
METRQVRIGCTFTYVADIATPVVFHVQPRSDPDIALAGERLTSEPEMALRDYTDLYGNPCTRAILVAAYFRPVTSRRPVGPDAVSVIRPLCAQYGRVCSPRRGRHRVAA